MTIHFYLNNEEETEITAFYDMKSNPFNINDIVSLDVEWMTPRLEKQLNLKKPDFKALEEKREKLRLKNIKLIKELKFVTINITAGLVAVVFSLPKSI